MDTATVAVLVTWAMAMMYTGVAFTMAAGFGLMCWRLTQRQPQPATLNGGFFDLIKFGVVPIDRVGRVTVQAEHEGYERAWQYIGDKFAYFVYTSPQLTGDTMTV